MIGYITLTKTQSGYELQIALEFNVAAPTVRLRLRKGTSDKDQHSLDLVDEERLRFGCWNRIALSFDLGSQLFVSLNGETAIDTNITVASTVFGPANTCTLGNSLPLDSTPRFASFDFRDFMFFNDRASSPENFDAFLSQRWPEPAYPRDSLQALRQTCAQARAVQTPTGRPTLPLEPPSTTASEISMSSSTGASTDFSIEFPVTEPGSTETITERPSVAPQTDSVAPQAETSTGSDPTILIILVVLAAIVFILAVAVGVVWAFKKRGASAKDNDTQMSIPAQQSKEGEPIYGQSSFSDIR